METKVDKRTKEYKESLKQPSESGVVEDTTTGVTTQIPVTFSGTIPAVPIELKAEPVEGVYIKDAYSKVENNPKFRRCMHCWNELPPNEDGTPKYRKVPEPCDECIWRNYES